MVHLLFFYTMQNSMQNLNLMLYLTTFMIYRLILKSFDLLLKSGM